MGSLVRPKLRSFNASHMRHGGQEFVRLDDPSEVVVQPILIPLRLYQQVERRFDGRSSLAEIREIVHWETSEDLSASKLQKVVSRLDQALILDGPCFENFRHNYRRHTATRSLSTTRCAARSARSTTNCSNRRRPTIRAGGSRGRNGSRIFGGSADSPQLTRCSTMGEAPGPLLKYGQAVDEARDCCVSFASMAFVAERA